MRRDEYKNSKFLRVHCVFFVSFVNPEIIDFLGFTKDTKKAQGTQRGFDF